jgi:hypothetical protein
MNIVNVYTKKEYKCNACNKNIYYAQVARDDGEIYTTDGNKFNYQYGKNSNAVSCPVLVDNPEQICCATKKDEVYKYVDDSNGVPHIPVQGSNQQKEDEVLKDFKPKLLSQEDLILWDGIIEKCEEYTLRAQQKINERGRINIAEVKGMITKMGSMVLLDIKRHEREQQKEQENE